ncbi:hypothetical protein BDV27DRAFT_131856 [Aspergillus caelatus]|uniref:Uncharacterized protein n=1 Tax=Aspergillus caelatus TaxID=61420 RepID=A0A5N6ZXY5_9EURO|nr:uncharacterized protein BDV27DRAFT_131856 [Aspergillus caelatus]KAE8362238.1 hypothetical protein BDV27DRAFT_131856 [Aspergillus caelatus]
MPVLFSSSFCIPRDFSVYPEQANPAHFMLIQVLCVHSCMLYIPIAFGSRFL